MTYKLDCERKHRVARGASIDKGKPRLVIKGERNGRIIRSRYDAEKDRIVMYHVTKGTRSRNRVGYLGPAQ